MSLGLLKDYSSDSSDSETDLVKSCPKSIVQDDVHDECNQKEARASNFFDAIDSTDESSTSDEPSSPDLPCVIVTENTSEGLPLPELTDVHHGHCNISGSIYSNPYKEAEDAKLRILEHHVPLTADVEKTSEVQFCKRQKRKGEGSVKNQTRSGLPRDLYPSKKYIKVHREFQEKERPWTLKK